MGRRVRLFAVMAVVVVSAGCTSARDANRQVPATHRDARSVNYVVTWPRGVRHRMTPQAVASIVRAKLGHGASIRRIILARDESAVPVLEPPEGHPTPRLLPTVGPVWVVQAHGDYAMQREPPDHGSGYYVIADRDGAILSIGLP